MALEYKPSCFLATKGAMIESTYRAFQHWDLDATLAANVRRIRAENPVGGPSIGWLKMFCKVLTRRFGIAETMRPLVELVQQGWELGDWRPIMLWHISTSDPLLTDFIANWLFERRRQGIVLLKTEAARQYLRSYLHAELGDAGAWSDANIAASASGLLRTAADFGLLRGRQVKQFQPYRLRDQSLTYLLHAIMEREGSTQRVILAADWRLFLMKPADVEEELLRLHQFGKLRFDRAGSLVELTLPYRTATDYARSTAP